MKSKLSRRTVLQGTGGIALGLPFLEAMGAKSLYSNDPVRLAYMVMPNGIGPDSIWDPHKTGKGYDTHSSLAALEPVKDLVNVHTGLNGPDKGHFSTITSLLTGLKVGKNPKLDGPGATIDQVAAEQIGKDCIFPSLEFSLDKPKSGVHVEGVNIGFGHYLSWGLDKKPVPREIDPAAAFRRLFKGAKRSSATTGNNDFSKSILDYVKDDAGRLKRILGREDLTKVNEYYYSIRAIERRIAKLSTRSRALPAGTNAPKANIDDRWERARALIDIIVLAFQTDRTRVASFLFARDATKTMFPFLKNVKEHHHDLAHYKKNKDFPRQLTEVNKFHLSFYVQMIKKMSEVKEGRGTLLDNSLILFSSNFKSGMAHNQKNLAALVAGGGGGSVKTGYHHRHSDKNFSSLLLGMAKTAGCNLDSFAGEKSALI